MTTFLIFIAFIIFCFYMARRGFKKIKEQKLDKLSRGMDISKTIKVGKYLSGHPNIDKPVVNVEITPGQSELNIYAGGKELGTIKKESIKNVLAEDASTMEKRVTVGRLLLVGVFAFAFKKNKKSELAYVTIEWNDSRFDHETIFEFTGSNAMQEANTTRNKLIKLIS